MSKAGQVMLAAGVGGLLVWIGVRGSTWLEGELAYYRWRRQRFPSSGMARGVRRRVDSCPEPSSPLRHDERNPGTIRSTALP